MVSCSLGSSQASVRKSLNSLILLLQLPKDQRPVLCPEVPEVLAVDGVEKVGMLGKEAQPGREVRAVSGWPAIPGPVSSNRRGTGE